MSEAAAESIFGSVGWFWAEWERRVGGFDTGKLERVAQQAGE